MRAYVDTDILIWHLRGEPRARTLLKRLRDDGGYDLWTGALQRGEVLFHTLPEEEETTALFLSQFQTAPVDAQVIDLAARLFREWHPSSGIDENDAILAATAALSGGHIFTQNLKHYPMSDLVVKAGW